MDGRTTNACLHVYNKLTYETGELKMAPDLFSFFYMNIFVHLLSLVLVHFILASEYQLVI